MGVKRRLPTQCKHCLTAVLFYVCMFESSIEKARLSGLVGEEAGFKVESTWGKEPVCTFQRIWELSSMEMDELSSQGPGIILTPLRGMAHAGPHWTCCFQHMEVK